MCKVLCRCGCGKALTPYQIRKNGKYASKACEARWRRYNSEKYKLYARPNSKYSYLGEQKCTKYNDTDIKCVMCYEQDLYFEKDCRGIPTKKMRINGRQYCINYDKNDLKCILCVEQAIFKCRQCYGEVK